MSQVYESAARISYFDLDCRGRLRLSALLRMAGNAGDENAGQLGVGHAVIGPRGMSFILQRFGLAVARMPQYGESVAVRSWPSEIVRGTFFTRQGDMRDGAGNKLMEWNSLWILFDLKRRKILRPAALGVDLPLFGDMGVCVQPEKIDLPEGWGSPYSSSLHTVRCCEVDTNMHMNSAVYGDLIENALYDAGDGLGGGPDWVRVQVNYMAEAKFGDGIEVQCRREGGRFLITGANSGGPGPAEPPPEARRTAFAALVETA
ncbi:MAG: thioesterase [Chitinispirillia bacterium]|nr:thioesterase [Chitinispirillia bacterium]MCL2269625.1 thioesterase [Chitinispirillia bacterium]